VAKEHKVYETKAKKTGSRKEGWGKVWSSERKEGFLGKKRSNIAFEGQKRKKALKKRQGS